MERRPLPDHIIHAPTLLPGQMFFFQAFLALSSCRPIGMDEGRIPWTAAYQYACDLDLDAEEFEDMWAMISYMDTAYIKHQRKKQPSK
jgi:hypothetical protein